MLPHALLLLPALTGASEDLNLSLLLRLLLHFDDSEVNRVILSMRTTKLTGADFDRGDRLNSRGPQERT